MDNQKSDNGEHIKCDICLKEVPRSEAERFEAQDYVMHFCGLECYEKWQTKQKKPQREE